MPKNVNVRIGFATGIANPYVSALGSLPDSRLYASDGVGAHWIGWEQSR